MWTCIYKIIKLEPFNLLKWNYIINYRQGLLYIKLIFCTQRDLFVACLFISWWYPFLHHMQNWYLMCGGGRVVWRCCVSYITGVSNWYWLTIGQGLLSLEQVRVEAECFYFFCFFIFIPIPLSSLSLSFISSSISFLPFSRRRHKMTHNGLHVVQPQDNQSIFYVYFVQL